MGFSQKRAFIYSLVDPQDNLIFYVGRSMYVEDRLNAHIANARTDKGSNKALNLLIRRILETGKKPTMTILQHSKNALVDEMKWIRHGWRAGWPLVNIHI